MSSEEGITSRGASESWMNQQANAKRLFNLFAATMEGLGEWDTLEEATLIEPKLYQKFADYLVNTYKSETGRNAGNPLSLGTVINTLGIVLNLASTKYKPNGSAETKLFFTCLDPNSTSESARWLRGVKNNITRIVFNRSKEAGEEMDKSATPLYPHHVEAVNRAYARADGAEAAARKFAITVAYQISGRTSEAAWVTLDAMEWDGHFNCLIAEVPQSKTVKLKIAAFFAGVNQHRCFFTALGDNLALNRPPPSEDNVDWLLPDLHAVCPKPGKRLGSYLKALLPRDRGGAATYARYAVANLPDDVSGAGLRPGVINALAAKMPADFVTAMTGHDTTGLSSLYEYLDPDRAVLMAAVIVMAGYLALPWGHLGLGPVPASFDWLCSRVDNAALTRMMASLFYVDGLRAFMMGAPLRPALEAAFASLVMYYEDRERLGEMRSVGRKMRYCWRGAFRPTATDVEADAVLRDWSKLLRAKFNSDNLHLTSPPATVNVQPIVTAVTRLTNLVESQARTISELQEALVENRLELSNMRNAISNATNAPAGTAAAAGGGPVAPTVTAAATGPAASTAAAASAAARAAARTAAPTAAPVVAAPARAAAASAAARTAAPVVAAPARAAAAVPAAAPSVPVPPRSTILMPDRGPTTAETIKGVDAPDFYVRCMQLGGSLPAGLSSQDSSRANTMLQWFNAMATAGEKTQLLPTVGSDQTLSDRDKHALALKLDGLIQDRFACAYRDLGIDVPTQLLPQDKKGKKRRRPPMKVGSISDRMASIKSDAKKRKKESELTLSVSDFQAYRRKGAPRTLRPSPRRSPRRSSPGRGNASP